MAYHSRATSSRNSFFTSQTHSAELLLTSRNPTLMVGGLRFLYSIGEDEESPFIIDHVAHPEVRQHEQAAAVALLRAFETYLDARAVDTVPRPGNDSIYREGSLP